jgi:hypothetical protein
MLSLFFFELSLGVNSCNAKTHVVCIWDLSTKSRRRGDRLVDNGVVRDEGSRLAILVVRKQDQICSVTEERVVVDYTSDVQQDEDIGTGQNCGFGVYFTILTCTQALFAGLLAGSIAELRSGLEVDR